MKDYQKSSVNPPLSIIHDMELEASILKLKCIQPRYSARPHIFLQL